MESRVVVDDRDISGGFFKFLSSVSTDSARSATAAVEMKFLREFDELCVLF